MIIHCLIQFYLSNYCLSNFRNIFSFRIFLHPSATIPVSKYLYHILWLDIQLSIYFKWSHNLEIMGNITERFLMLFLKKDRILGSSKLLIQNLDFNLKGWFSFRNKSTYSTAKLILMCLCLSVCLSFCLHFARKWSKMLTLTN